MKAQARRALWEKLQAACLVTGEFPAEERSPWFIRLMLGIAGWIGAMFLLGFIGTGFAMVMRSAGTATVVGLLCCGGAYGIFLLAPKGDFASQFGLATGIAGQSLMAVGIFQGLHAESFAPYFVFFCVEAALTVLMPNFLHRLFTTVGGVAALSLGLAQSGIHWLALPLVAAGCALVWRGEGRLAARADLWQPVGYGLALGMLQTATTTLFRGELEHLFHTSNAGWWLLQVGTALVGVVFLAVTLDILRQLEIELFGSEGITLLICSLLFLLVSFPAHGLAAAALILLLGFAGGNRILFGLGLLAMVSFLSHYYYQMNETLLIKSLILGSTGLLLLLVRWGLRWIIPEQEGRTGA